MNASNREDVLYGIANLQQPWLLVLDNADDEAIWGKGELSCDRTLTKYLPKTLNGSILVTTRTRKLATSQAGKEVIELREMEPGEAFSTFHRPAF